MNRLAARLAAAVLPCLAALSAGAQQGAGNVVYVPTPQPVVEAMLRMAAVRPGDYLIDLGSGDGRIVITAAKKHGAQAMGVELDRYLIGMANDAARKEGVADRARFVEQDLFETNLAGATVITSYLLPSMNLKLRPRLLAMPPGTRVVTHDYHMDTWLPDESATLEVPEKRVGTAGISYVYLWYVPARIAGQWEAEMGGGAARRLLKIDIAQRFQQFEGVLRLGDQSASLNGTWLRGDEIRFGARVTAGAAVEDYEFSGRVREQVIEGSVSRAARGTRQKMAWSARLIAAAAPHR